MKTFRVFVTSVERYCIDVEANDKDEAYDIAKNTDGGDFDSCGDYGTWDIEEDTIKEIK